MNDIDVSKDLKSLEFIRKSAAVTLSDMEIFIFPELMYSLVLANIMSPRIWEWRDDPWFKNLDSMNDYRKIQRLKQYIMDNYGFNLDLDTWGMTDKKTELSRFKDFINHDTLKNSNALFGYEGDKYYFDIDIRKHFGLDKYTDDVIPYWKTETVEAMDAFIHKEDYTRGAGECVSLAALYAAALFIIAKIPLDDIFLMATPLHSQNFVVIKDGLLTNNRRIVTKKMWVNGTALSAKARRALENEKVTIVSHHTGHIHTMYEESSISDEAYSTFSNKLKDFLKSSITVEILINFLRDRSDFQKYFQFEHVFHGKVHYIPLSRIFAYEHTSPYMFSDKTRDKLLDEMDCEEFHQSDIGMKCSLNRLESFVKSISAKKCSETFRDDLRNVLTEIGFVDADDFIEALCRFCIVDPNLPDISTKTKNDSVKRLEIAHDMDREQIIDHITSIRDHNLTADLAFYAYRDVVNADIEPFVEAALCRNPVAVEAVADMEQEEILAIIEGFNDLSIYTENIRMAQPDEAWNYRTGDGAEKAFLLATIFKKRFPEETINLSFSEGKAVFKATYLEKTFSSKKAINKELSL